MVFFSVKDTLLKELFAYKNLYFTCIKFHLKIDKIFNS